MFRFRICISCIRFRDPSILLGDYCVVLFRFSEHENCWIIFGLEGFCRLLLVPKTFSEATRQIRQFRLAICPLTLIVECPPKIALQLFDCWVKAASFAFISQASIKFTSIQNQFQTRTRWSHRTSKRWPLLLEAPFTNIWLLMASTIDTPSNVCIFKIREPTDCDAANPRDNLPNSQNKNWI